MPSNIAARNSWKQPMTGDIAPRNWTWPANAHQQYA
jgi:hypothetical protein